MLLAMRMALPSAGSAATKYITAVATAAPSSVNWTTWSTTTLNSSDNSYANTGTNTTATGTLCGFNFSAIPSSAGIEGIQVNMEASETNAAVNGYIQTAVSSNSGTNYSADTRSPSSGSLATSDTGYVAGNSTTTWGINWTVAGATSTFLLRMWASDSSVTAGRVVQIDSVTVTAYYDDTAPSTSTLASVQSSTATGQINLSWNVAGDDDTSGNLTGNYRIQYATYTVAWSTSSTPTDATTVTIATANAVPGAAQSQTITGLVTETTYYFVLWSQDNVNFWSTISNTASAFLDMTSPSTTTLSAVTGSNWSEVNLSWASAGDDGSTGNLTGNYRIQYATYTVAWSTSSTPTNATTITIATTSATPGTTITRTITGLTATTTYYFVLWTSDEGNNWSSISNTPTAMPPYSVTLAEAVAQAGWMARGETARILGTAQIVSDNPTNITISSVAVQETGSYTADGNLTNVEVWVSSSGYIDATAVRLEGAAKAFSSNTAVFTQDVVVSTTPLYFIARCDVSGSATEGTFDISLQIYTTAVTANNPLAFSNATDVVAPPSGAPSGLTATAASNLLQVNLSWGGATGADSYSIYRATYSGVTTTDFLLGMTDTTSFADDYMVPNQQMYYAVVGTNRAGASGTSATANATTVDIPALTTSNIYLRAGIPGNFGDGGRAFSESVNPYSSFIDASGNIYIADRINNRIRFVAKTGGTYFGQSMTANSLYTIAGNGTSGYLADNVAATATRIFYPYGVSVDTGGNIYIADTYNHRIRFVPKTGGTYFGQSMTANCIYTIAGNGTGGYVADSVAATATQIRNPTGVSVDASGNVYIADYNNSRIRFVAKTGGTYFGQSMTANSIYTIAGNGTPGNLPDGVAATAIRMSNPAGVSVDTGGNVYTADYGNNRLLFVPKTGGTYFGQPMTANYIYTIVGYPTAGYLADNVAANATKINTPYGSSVDHEGNIYIADSNNNRIRFVPKTGGTYFGQSMTANSIYTIAGNGTGSYVADDVAATATPIQLPNGTSVDAGGNIYIADSNNNRIRFVPKTGGTYFGQSMTANSIYTIAGNGTAGYVADNVSATATQMNNPYGVSVDAGGNIYIADSSNNRIRFVPKTGGTYFGQPMTANSIYTIGGTGSAGYNGENAVATGKKRLPPLVFSPGLTTWCILPIPATTESA